MASHPGGRRLARRVFLIRSTVLATAPLAPALVFGQQDAQKLNEDSPQAQALHYVHNAHKATDPKRQPDQYCYNCQLFQSKKKEGWGPCQIFPGKLVAAKGWCSSWIKQS